MQFASGRGPKKSTVSVVGGVWPQRTYDTANYVPGMVLDAAEAEILTDYSYKCALNSNTSGNEIGAITVTMEAEAGWSGTATVVLQGGFHRYDNDDANWVDIGSTSATIDTANQAVVLQVTADEMWPVYRLKATTTDASGIIDWAIANMFPDLSAEHVGENATLLQPHIGQGPIVTNSTIPFGRNTNWYGSTGNTGDNQEEIELQVEGGGMN